MDIRKIVKKVNKILKNNEDYKDDENMKVQYILLDENKKIYNIVCYGWDEILSVDPKTFEIQPVFDWAYSYDMDIFEELENGKTIGYMTNDIHYNIWCKIDEWYPEDINCKSGLELYIKYCDENGITKEYLDKMFGLDTPDIMNNFTNMEVGEMLRYKGYIAYIQESNLNNNNENIVYIYQNEKDYISGDYIEIVSLNGEDTKKNIKAHIDKTYSPKPKENPNFESERAYFTFVLGYDLLQNMFKNFTVQECDLVYDFCSYEAEQFLESNEYQNLKYSGYEMLVSWTEKNKDKILADYMEKTNNEPVLYNDNMRILEKGFRKDQPVALIEKSIGDSTKEYIVAFYYKVDDYKLSWGYAYYYDDNKQKAEKYYKKAINGGSLTHSFDREQEEC